MKKVRVELTTSKSDDEVNEFVDELDALVQKHGGKVDRERQLAFAREMEADCTIGTGNTGNSGKYTREVAARSAIRYRLEQFAPEDERYMMIVDELIKTRAEYITLPLISQWMASWGPKWGPSVFDKQTLKKVYELVSTLASERHQVLDPRFELLREDDSTIDIPAKDVHDALKGGKLYDPDSGYEVKDWEKQVIPYWVPTETLRAAYAKP